MSTTDLTISAELSWKEWVTVRRLRLGWTKADLSERSGVSRTWLWRGLECDPDDERAVDLSEDVRAKIEEALSSAETVNA